MPTTYCERAAFYARYCARCGGLIKEGEYFLWSKIDRFHICKKCGYELDEIARLYKDRKKGRYKLEDTFKGNLQEPETRWETRYKKL